MLQRCGLVNEECEALEFLSAEVGEGGRCLSAGQRQLLCLARALFRRGPTQRGVVCLDEATASLDDACEAKIQVNKTLSLCLFAIKICRSSPSHEKGIFTCVDDPGLVNYLYIYSSHFLLHYIETDLHFFIHRKPLK